jgi:hypothetical protein
MPESPNTTHDTIGRATSHEHLSSTNEKRNSTFERLTAHGPSAGAGGMSDKALRAGFAAADRYESPRIPKKNETVSQQGARELTDNNARTMSVRAAQEMAKYEK